MIDLIKPEKPLQSLLAIARSGMKGTTQARAEIRRRKLAQLANELKRGANA